MRTPQVVGLALVIGVFFTAQASLMSLVGDRRLDFQKDVLPDLIYWIVWAAFAPLLRAAVRRWPLDSRPLRRPIAMHLAIGMLMSLVQTTIAFGVHPVISWARGLSTPSDVAAWLGRTQSFFVWGLFMGVMFYAFVVGAFSVLRLSRQRAALEGELAHAKLDALRSQLRPHFLFNTLNAISVLSQQDALKARHMLLRLSSLLRRSLDEESHEVALDDELSFLREYLDIMRVRLGEQLDVRVSVEPDVLEARVPVFLLQPLVENAIEHGEGDDGRTVISVAASRRAEELFIVVENSSGANQGSSPAREGIGLGNTRARLRELYGDHASLQFAAPSAAFAPDGTRVELMLPLARAAAI